MAAVVVSASYPHTILHLNKAWLDEMMPDYLHAGKSTGIYIYIYIYIYIGMLYKQNTASTLAIFFLKKT
jgi:hypothetical protein